MGLLQYRQDITGKTLNEDIPSSSRSTIGNDNRPVEPRSLAKDFLMGLRFFSRLPTGSGEHEAPDFNRMAPALGLVSIAIAMGPAVLVLLLAWLEVPLLLAVVIGIAALALVTGAMTEDALADGFDGLWGGHDRERRLEIMHDSRHGTYGVLTIVVFFAARMSVLVALYVAEPVGAIAVWVAAQVLARQAALWLPLKLPPARQDGAGYSAGLMSGRMFWIGMTIALVIGGLGILPFAGIFGTLAGLVVGGMVVAGWTHLCAKKVGGFTGDLTGALNGLVEIVLLTTFIIFV